MSSPLPPFVLAYHAIGDYPIPNDSQGLFVRPADLRRHIARLVSWGYRLSTFGDLAERARSGDASGWAALTFDDGFRDNLELIEIGVPATVFVVTGWLGGMHPDAPTSQLLSADDVRALHAAEIEIGAHTVTHPDLTTLSGEDATEELRESKRALEQIVDAPIHAAAYPYGRATEVTFAACADAGFQAACRSTGAGSWTQQLNLPRQDMDGTCSRVGLRLKRDGRYEPLMQHVVGRAGRRLARYARRALA